MQSKLEDQKRCPASGRAALEIHAALEKVLQKNRIASEALSITISDLQGEFTAIGESIEHYGELVASLEEVMKSLSAFKEVFLGQEAGYKVTIVHLQASSRKLNQISTMTAWLAKQLPELRHLFVNMDDKLKALHNLSFNISIEAARAGEKGVGFKVITVEVRKLKDAIADILPKVKTFIENTLDQGLGTTAAKIGEANRDLGVNLASLGGMQKKSLEQIQEISLVTESLELTVKALVELLERQKQTQHSLGHRLKELDATRDLLILEIAVEEPRAPIAPPVATPPPALPEMRLPEAAHETETPTPRQVPEDHVGAWADEPPAPSMREEPAPVKFQDIKDRQGLHLLESQGKSYVVINYIHFPDDDSLLEKGCLDLIARARKFYETLPDSKKVRAISNFTGTKAVKEVPKKLAELAEVAMRHQEKSAVVGIQGVQKLYLATINRLHGGKSRFRVPFDTVEKAWGWIAN